MKHTDNRYKKKISNIIDPCIAVLKTTTMQDHNHIWYVFRSRSASWWRRWVIVEIDWRDKNNNFWSINLVESYNFEELLNDIEKISIVPKVLDLYNERNARATSRNRNMSNV